MLNINGFNQRINIQKRNIIKDKGVPIDTWDDYYTCWCSVNSLYGTELYKALEIQLQNIMQFTVRYTKALDNLNTKEYRVVWSNRNFNIIAVDYFSYNKEKIVIKAQEVL
ncbi:phage head closure protein [Clostridium sp. 19966]|uniref:phage head closure protein n=1 Tax=Clostridium sp. 19966 TaxID=2768166 RepID=UPI0028DEC7AA|nr:phage head closure protein [Clostridium sp. 19966]MDT8718987.1 phage head closure protein [Clostridium sp. 19966]